MENNLENHLRSIGIAESELKNIQFHMALERLAELEDTLERIITQVDLQKSMRKIVTLESALISAYLDMIGEKGQIARDNILTKRSLK